MHRVRTGSNDHGHAAPEQLLEILNALFYLAVRISRRRIARVLIAQHQHRRGHAETLQHVRVLLLLLR